jgi:hypothetical protein
MYRDLKMTPRNVLIFRVRVADINVSYLIVVLAHIGYIINYLHGLHFSA